MAKTTKKQAANANASPPSAIDAYAIAICAAHGNKASELLEILHDIQHKTGHVPESVLPVIANALNLSRAEVYGVVTFYHDFHREPVGKHVIKICRAEACQSMGTNDLCAHAQKKLAKFGETSADGKFTLEAAYCLGNCALSPAVLIDETLYGKVDAKRFDEIVGKIAKETV